MTRYHARWLLPVSAPPIRNGTVVVDRERIAWVGARANAPPGDDVDLGDAVLLPGLVNTHIHLDLAGFEGVLGGLAFPDWIRALVRGLTEALDGDALADASRWSVADQLAHGVTTIGHTGPSAVAFDAMREMGARGVAYLETFGPDPSVVDAAMADLRARVARARREETALVRVGVSPHAPYTVSDALYSAAANFARDESLPVAVHIAESAAESRLVARGEGPFAEQLRARAIAVGVRAPTPVALLDRTGVLACRPLCIHAVEAGADDVRRLADAGASVAHCPRANAWLGHGRAPVAAFTSAGLRVGLGTDSIASNDTVRIIDEARAAADDNLPPAGRLAMATRGGAEALALGDVCGSLRAGLRADLAAFAIGDLAACDRDPARYFIDHCGASPSVLTIIDGVVRARNGRALAADAKLDARMARQRARVRAWADDWRSPRS